MKDKLHHITNRITNIYTANLGLEPAMSSNKLQLMPNFKYNLSTTLILFTPNENLIITRLKTYYNA